MERLWVMGLKVMEFFNLSLTNKIWWSCHLKHPPNIPHLRTFTIPCTSAKIKLKDRQYFHPSLSYKHSTGCAMAICLIFTIKLGNPRSGQNFNAKLNLEQQPATLTVCSCLPLEIENCQIIFVFFT